MTSRIAGLLRVGLAVLAVGLAATGHAQAAVGTAFAAVVSIVLGELSSAGIDVAGAGVLTAHAVGSAAGLPERIVVWDVTVHAMVAALVVIALGGMLPPLSVPGMLLLASLGMALAVEWEALEFLVDTAAGSSYAPSLADTGRDLAGDAAGIAIGLVVVRAAIRMGDGLPEPRFLEDGL